MCVFSNLFAVYMYECNNVKSSTVTTGMIKVHLVMKKLLRGQLTNGIET